MKKCVHAGVWIMLLVLIALWAVPAGTGQAPAGNAAPRWEYKTYVHEGTGWAADESLNKLGEEGWELVSGAAKTAKQELLYVFKRLKK